MRMIAYLLAIICVSRAAMYYTMPAGQLPAFMPGYLDGSAHIHNARYSPPPWRPWCCS